MFLAAISLLGAFISWYVFGAIRRREIRGFLRATVIALLCSPGVLVGHGIGLAPGLYALSVQPSIFTLGPMFVIWVIALAVIFLRPTLRNDRTWPPTLATVVLSAYPGKFVLFGVVAAGLMASVLYADQSERPWAMILQYTLFFVGAVVNLLLCYSATRVRQAQPYYTPLLFALPVTLAVAPVVCLVWYGGGLVGGLAGTGRRRIAGWIAVGVFAGLAVNALSRTYEAAVAQAHVTIQGGVAGNALMVALYALVAFIIWYSQRAVVDEDK